jgi:hypothetical protein
MENLKNLFDSFYDHFVLRDFFGKIVPGFVLLSTVLICLFSWINLYSNINTIPILAWIVIFGFAWIIGFSIQSIGEVFKLIRYYPKNFTNDQKYYEFYVDFFDSAKDVEKTRAERLMIIRDACGNAFIAFSISLIIIFVCLIFGLIQLKNLQTIFVLVLIIPLLSYFLYKMHHIHVQRLYDFMKACLDFHQKTKN